ncbi:MAG TPA: hypothetical protein VMJ93_13400 [Verrucomicrobiae bacterium]|nr:hypothetical protein [Verrucomicrobiae bacterium]
MFRNDTKLGGVGALNRQLADQWTEYAPAGLWVADLMLAGPNNAPDVPLIRKDRPN